MADDKNKPYSTKPNTQLDLEARLSDDYTPESNVGNTVTVNPNPYGSEAYVGTDPIYQNHANDTEKPYAAKSGAEKKAEEQVKELYSLDDVDDDQIVDDYGFGGKARVAVQAVPTASDVLVGGGDVTHTREEKPAEEPTNTESDAGDPKPANSPSPTPTQPAQAGDKNK